MPLLAGTFVDFSIKAVLGTGTNAVAGVVQVNANHEAQARDQENGQVANVLIPIDHESVNGGDGDEEDAHQEEEPCFDFHLVGSLR